MLQWNLLYTAITRAKKLVVLVGNRKAMAIAIRNNRVQRRYTAFVQSLMLSISVNGNDQISFRGALF